MTKKSIFVLLPLIFWVTTVFYSEPSPEPPLPGGPERAKNTLPLRPAPLQSHVLKIKWGMTLDRLLRKANVPVREAREMVRALRSVYNPRKIRAGDRIQLLRDARQTVQELRYRPFPELTVRICRDSTGQFYATTDTLPLVHRQTLVKGQIVTTLYEAILTTGESPELIMAFSDIFQWDIDFFIDPRKGDRFSILVEKQFVVDAKTGMQQFVRYGPILAAAYQKSDTTLMAFGYPDRRGRLRYYDRRGRSFQKTFLKSPLNYRRITSYFSWRRWHPILKRVRAHTGVDFAAPKGTPVVAAADGKIIYRGWKGGYGKCIEISHKNGRYVTLYGHLSGFARKVHKNSLVRQGQLIGYVGATGLATGPHLHYTMYYNGKPINPLKIRPLSGKPIPKNQMPAFRQRAAVLSFRMGLGQPHQTYSALLPQEGVAR